MENIKRPPWNTVVFPTGYIRTYGTLEKANNARILARAWFNFEAQDPSKKGRKWAAISRYLGMIEGVSRNAGMPFYSLVYEGKLPKDETVKQKLFELAGYPWD